MIPIPKFSPAAYNRFIYYPDRLSRVPAPRPFAGLLANFWDIRRSLREPVFKGLLSSILMEPFRSRPRDCPDDESVAEFISRKLSPRVADNLFSAMFHGIFAGDINRLSARSLLGTLYESDETHGSYFRYLLERRRLNTRKVRMANAMTTNVADLGRMEQDKYKTLMRRTSVFTWERGLGQLIDGLVAALSKSPKVEIVTEAGVNGISQDPSSSDLIVCERRICQSR